MHLDITDEAKRSLAKLSTQINREVENIGARRLRAGRSNIRKTPCPISEGALSGHFEPFRAGPSSRSCT